MNVSQSAQTSEVLLISTMTADPGYKTDRNDLCFRPGLFASLRSPCLGSAAGTNVYAITGRTY